MKKILYLSLFAILTSCLSEKNADPGKPDTFVRYFNGGNNDVALVAEETSDKEIIILGTSEITSADGLTFTFKIKLIKTNEYGNVIWSNVYPAFGASTESIKASSLLQLASGGFLVIGENILPNGESKMYILEVGPDGNQVAATTKTIDFPTLDPALSIQGKAIQLNSDGNYLVLGTLEQQTDPSKPQTGNMVLAKLDKADLSIKWMRDYGAGTSSLSSKIYLDGANNIFWSGTAVRNSSDIRLVKTTPNSLNTIFDLAIGKSNFDESGNDICRYGNGFAVVGNTNEKAAGVQGDQEILFKVLADDGSELLSKTFGFGDTDAGNAVCTARGGIVILGTSNAVSEADGGRGAEDYFLMKVDAFGNDVWPKPKVFGSKNRDLGASVRQLSDGSLLVLGTTVFGGVRTIMLMKADSEGNIR